MSSSTLKSPGPINRAEFVVWTLATLVGALLVPGLGIVIGLVLAFTRLRFARPLMRWSLVAAGTVFLVFQVVGLASGSGTSHVSPESRVS